MIQFTVSIFLIAFTLLVYWQLRFLMIKDMGFNRNNVIVQEGFVPADQRESFKQEIGKMPDIISSAAASTEVTGGFYPGFMVQVEKFGSDVITSRFIVADDDFIETLEIKMIDGRDFSEDFNDSMNVIINRTAVREFNLDHPIGARLLEPVDTGGGTMIREFTVLAIVIACVGLFGLAAYTAGQKTRKIGIRKVAGPIKTGKLFSLPVISWEIYLSGIVLETLHSPAFPVVMFDQFLCKGLGIYRICVLGVKMRMTIDHIKLVRSDKPDGFVIADIGKFHILTVPMEFPFQSLQPDRKHAHYNHLIQGTGIPEV